jgi:hypothetical protein
MLPPLPVVLPPVPVVDPPVTVVRPPVPRVAPPELLVPPPVPVTLPNPEVVPPVPVAPPPVPVTPPDPEVVPPALVALPPVPETPPDPEVVPPVLVALPPVPSAFPPVPPLPAAEGAAASSLVPCELLVAVPPHPKSPTTAGANHTKRRARGKEDTFMFLSDWVKQLKLRVQPGKRLSLPRGDRTCCPGLVRDHDFAVTFRPGSVAGNPAVCADIPHKGVRKSGYPISLRSWSGW